MVVVGSTTSSLPKVGEANVVEREEEKETEDEESSDLLCLMVGCQNCVTPPPRISRIFSVSNTNPIGQRWKEKAGASAQDAELSAGVWTEGRDDCGRRYHYQEDAEDEGHEFYCSKHEKHSQARGYACGTKFPELYPMLVLDAELFIQAGQIPRFDDPRFDSTPGLRLQYAALQNRQECFVIFVSHRWLSPAMDKKGHPDRLPTHPKHRMLAKAIQKLSEMLKDKKIYLWIDFSCVVQDNLVETMRGIDSLPSYVERCDVLLTPLVEDEGAAPWWENGGDSAMRRRKNLFDDYHSPAWIVYKNRAWCRLEFFVAANAPMHPDSQSYFLLVSSSPHCSSR
jgi:hypothetical protein